MMNLLEKLLCLLRVNVTDDAPAWSHSAPIANSIEKDPMNGRPTLCLISHIHGIWAEQRLRGPFCLPEKYSLHGLACLKLSGNTFLIFQHQGGLADAWSDQVKHITYIRGKCACYFLVKASSLCSGRPCPAPQVRCRASMASHAGAVGRRSR